MITMLPQREQATSANSSVTALSGINRAAYITLIIGLIGSGIWLFTAEISSAVILNGAIKVYRNRSVLQHPEGGKIGRVLVNEGQQVEAGQVLLELDNPQLESTLRNLTRQLYSERIRSDRLNAEMHYPEPFTPSTTPADEEQTTIVLTEKSLFDSRRRNLTSQISSIQQQVDYVHDEINALTSSVANDEILSNKNKELVNKEFLSPIAALSSEQTLNQRKAELARANQRIAELQQRIPVLIEDFRNSAAIEQRTVNERLLEIEEKMRPLTESYTNLKVRAPAAGSLVNLLKLGPGSVLGAKETIAEIVPEGHSLIIEGSLPPAQVAYVKEGMPARVKIAQLRQIGADDLHGKVSMVSADSLTQGMLGTMAYLVQVEIDSLNTRQSSALKPGMPAEIYIQTGTRTPFDYLAEPVTAYLQRAAKEPN